MQINFDILLSLRGIGVSLINSKKQKAVLYGGISSSDVIWRRIVKKNTYEPFDKSLSTSLEAMYQQYLSSPSSNADAAKSRMVVDQNEVDFSCEPMQMYRPLKTSIDRFFEAGVNVWVRQSMLQCQMLIKIYKIQVDNPDPEAIFPSVFSRVAKEDAKQKSEPRSFFELGVFIRSNTRSSVVHVKYLKLLLQEMAVKVDMGFVSNVLEAISIDQTVDTAYALRIANFASDMDLANTQRNAYAELANAIEVQHEFDFVHISPLIVHIWSTLSGGKAEVKSSVGRNLRIYFKSIGIMMLEIEDMAVKLDYFERNYVNCSLSKLTKDVVHHYVRQILENFYVVLLGFKISGNPLQLIHDLGTGVHDLFYDPAQGIVHGPREFLRGLARGVVSFVSHTVGGAAGYTYRVTDGNGKTLLLLIKKQEAAKPVKGGNRGAASRPPSADV